MDFQVELARMSDARMGLYARLATAIEIQDGHIPVTADIATRQRADAVAAAQAAEPKGAFRLVLPRRRVLVATILAVVLVTGFILPNPQEAAIAQNRAEKEAIEKQAASKKKAPAKK